MNRKCPVFGYDRFERPALERFINGIYKAFMVCAEIT